MMSPESPVLPPRAAAWLVELFASPQEADGLLGDLAEEFSAAMLRDGETAARRHYRRHARHTVWDLAVVQWRTRPWWSAAIAVTGLLLVTGIGPAGIVVTGPISLAARTLVARYPVYDYVAPSVFSEIVLLLPSLLIGFLIALLARTIGLRSMSAALVFVVAIAVWNAVDTPIAMWLLGPPYPAQMTLAHVAARWAQGVLQFGGVATIGAAVGRLLSARLPFGLLQGAPR
jgi:hypothetical protein